MKIIKFWFPVFIYSGIIFYMSSLENLKAPGPGQFDKALHIIEFLPFGFLVARALCETKMTSSGVSMLVWTILISFLYALSDEFHQLFVIGRISSGADVVADVVGGLLGGCLYSRLMIKQQGKFKKES